MTSSCLTSLCLGVPLETVIRIYDIFDNGLGIKNVFTKYSCRVVGSVLMNIFPSNIFQSMLLPERFFQ